jgi:hypothetical protein
MRILTKDDMIQELIQIRSKGFIPNARHGNQGGIGNTLEDLLGIQENNLPIPNAAEWELKTKRLTTSSLVTLFHSEPSPRALRFVPEIFLPLYGWKHKNAGMKYPENEMSFRLTINALNCNDRGFQVVVDEKARKILISFDSQKVAKKHQAWLEAVEKNIGLGEINPQPYWGFSDIGAIAGTKLPNCFFVQAKVKKDKGEEFYHYQKITKLTSFNFEKFVRGLVEGFVLIDVDARTNHNHGTKFRIRQNRIADLYESAEEI